MRTRTMAWLVVLVLAVPGAALADAAGDLKAGEAALAAGQVDKALPLLESAAQALPQSVEAQLALARAYLMSGQLDKALQRFQAVLKLSPEHVQAKLMVEALSGQRRTFDEEMAYARLLISAGEYRTADAVLTKLVAGPVDPSQRLAARMLLAEVLLWSASSRATHEAMQIVRDAKDQRQVSIARVIAALTEADRKERTGDVLELLKEAGEVPAEWQPRADLARLVADFDEAAAPAISARVGGLLASLPPRCERRWRLIGLWSGRLLAAANARVGRGDRGGALAILIPMVSDQPVPKPDVVLKPVALTGGWLGEEERFLDARMRLVQALAAVDRQDFAAQGGQAALVGYWLAGEVLRQTPLTEQTRKIVIRQWLNLASELATVSRPTPDRKQGTVLSRADAIQREWILQIAPHLTEEGERGQLVDLLIAQIGRYEKAGDLETGLNQFQVVTPVRRAPAAGEPELAAVRYVPDLPAGPADRRLWEYRAGRYAHLGAEAFAKAAATLRQDPRSRVNAFDRMALSIYGGVAARYPEGKTAPQEAAKIIERYAAARLWIAADEATKAFYAFQNRDASRWALARLKVRQAATEEDQLLASNRQLPAALNPLIAQALGEVVGILQADPSKANVTAAKGLAQALINRYGALNRTDLAEAVIAALAGPKGATDLADWALLWRAGLEERQAAAGLALAAAQFDGPKRLALNDHHKAALALLAELVEKHRTSEYVGQAVDRVRHIATTYQTYKAFDVAAAVLADFVKGHPNLTAVERLRFAGVQVALAKARAAFADRPDKEKPPEALSAEYAAAIDALAAFLKAHPTGPHSLSAENELINVARTYGEVGAWKVARAVLARFKAAVPDFRSPERLRFLEAATYLGELDRSHGLSLLTPPAPPKPETPILGDLAIMVFANGGAVRVHDVRDLVMSMRTPEGAGAAGAVTAARPASAAEPGGAPRPQPSNGGRRRLEEAAPGSADKPDLEARLKAVEALSRIRQAERQQAVRLARLEAGQGQRGGQEAPQQQAVVLPGGPVLSEAEMKRQDAAADAAYAILIALIKDPKTAGEPVARQARGEVLWLIGFFEGQRRADRAVALIERYLKDRPIDPERVALAYQALNDRLTWAGRREAKEKIDQAWVDQRHGLFEEARQAIAAFIKEYTDKKDWVNRARMLAVTSYQKEAMLVASVSAARAGGLWARSAMELVALSRAVPDHPEAGQFPRRLWSIGEQLTTLRQREQAIDVLSQVPIRFPTDALATQSILQMAGLHAVDLSAPLKAVETYQEYMSLVGETQEIRSKVYTIAEQLAGAKRYLEALHVYGVFVDSFPTDGRSPAALLATGQIHQGNEAWDGAIQAYQRILTEYKTVSQVPAARLAIAECQTNLSQWRAARRLYEQYLEQYPRDGQAAMARSRIDVLKNLDRYQMLLADPKVTRHRDDAQFQIARIVLESLGNQVKAVAEFRKVVDGFPESHLADDAQMEIGKALLALNRLAEARAELMKVPVTYPQSPLADNALYLIGQSYEQQAERLAAVTLKQARELAFERRQRGAYAQFNVRLQDQARQFDARRDELKKAGKSRQLELEEAYQATRVGTVQTPDVSNIARFAEQEAETESALQVAGRQDRINEAYRYAVTAYMRAAADYPLGDMTDESLLQMAQIYEVKLKDRKAAMTTYQKVVKFFPGTPVAEDAAWKVATFYEQEGNDEQAVIAYRDFIRNYPASKRAADAQYAMAEALERLGRWVEAMDAYQTFREKFATHPQAPAAEDRQMWIRAYRM